MVLVDTSVWIDHFREVNSQLVELLGRSRVATHPFVIGELACGNLKNRQASLQYLSMLPRVPVADDLETLTFIERHALMGKGIGYVDVHLLASTALADATTLWSKDKRLVRVTSELNLSAPEQDL